jgi:thiamine-phosphate diphosphorylase
VQIRERGVDDRVLQALVRDALALARGTTTRVVVNDRLDVALSVAADGVHLPEAGLPIAAVRRLAGERLLVGRSVHDAASAAASRSADYLIAGSVFATASKPGRVEALGLSGLREIVSAAGECPVWAVGGITAETVGVIAECGARGVAAIGAFIPAVPIEKLARVVRAEVERMRFSFDTPAGLS